MTPDASAPNTSGPPDAPRTPARPRPAVRGRPGVLDLMTLVAGLAVGLGLVLPDLTGADPPRMGSLTDDVLLFAVAVLGGLAAVGPPILLAERRRLRRRFGPGRLLWFATGTSAWLLWPPVVARRLQGERFGNSQAGVCFAYGTPLMALYVTLALCAGGWLGLRKRRRRRAPRPRSWRERFGLILGLAWAFTGLYVLVNLYAADFD